MTLVKWKTANSVLDIFNNYLEFEDNRLDDYYRWSPSFDIKEYDKSYNIIADMPGIDKKDINVNIDKDMLIIEGNRKIESDSNEKWYCREIQHGEFKRKFYLPENINKDKVSASLENGVMKIEIEKIKPIKAKVKQINIT